MLSISPIPRALVPVDSAAAEQVAGPNYDEFQSDQEITDLIQRKPASILRVTMPHCDPEVAGELAEGGDAALSRATANIARLVGSDLMRQRDGVVYLYEMVDPTRPGVRQIGLGGLARTDQIRTADQPQGTIIRNEGIRGYKAKGRAALVNATSSYIGTVNLAVDDDTGRFATALEELADQRPHDYAVTDHKDNLHRIWLVDDAATVDRLVSLLAAEPHAYVADGNHRSAAAHMLGREHFLAVYFVASRMRIDPYHRLIDTLPDTGELLEAAVADFAVERVDTDLLVPRRVHEIGLYADGQWYRLEPRPHCFHADDAVQAIDSDILQRRFYQALLNISDPTDERLTFVGGDKGVGWLKGEVDAGRAGAAFALAPVTMDQFIDVCRQGRYMPPKSTWFEPKILSGLVIARF